MERSLDPNQLAISEDWCGNNAAFTCPMCSQVFIVSAVLNRHGRASPGCGKSTGFVTGRKDSGGTATIFVDCVRIVCREGSSAFDVPSE
jgi:hypothetical protein